MIPLTFLKRLLFSFAPLMFFYLLRRNRNNRRKKTPFPEIDKENIVEGEIKPVSKLTRPDLIGTCLR